MQIIQTKVDPHYESALMSAALILVCLTQERKSIEQIAKEDFDTEMATITIG